MTEIVVVSMECVYTSTLNEESVFEANLPRFLWFGLHQFTNLEHLAWILFLIHFKRYKEFCPLCQTRVSFRQDYWNLYLYQVLCLNYFTEQVSFHCTTQIITAGIASGIISLFFHGHLSAPSFSYFKVPLIISYGNIPLQKEFELLLHSAASIIMNPKGLVNRFSDGYCVMTFVHENFMHIFGILLFS